MQTNHSGACAFVEMTPDGIADHFAQFFHRVRLRHDAVSERLGDVSAFDVFFTEKMISLLIRFTRTLVYSYTGTGTLSTISRRISSACCDFFRVEV